MSQLIKKKILNLPKINKEMKTYILMLFIGIGVVPTLYGQEIIPFPDLSEKHIAVYNQKEAFDEYNYSLFTEDYQKALKNIDAEIKAKEFELESSEELPEKGALKSIIVELNKKRSNLLEEAELVEDLNKFY